MSHFEIDHGPNVDPVLGFSQSFPDRSKAVFSFVPLR